MEKYPNAKINIYGHSLGSMDAQYALACITDYSRINGAYIYNGPNIYSLLLYNQEITVTKDTQTTVADSTNAPRVRR